MSAKWWKTRRSETPARRATAFAVGSVSPARSNSIRASATLRRVRCPRATRPSRAGSSSATSAARSSGAVRDRVGWRRRASASPRPPAAAEEPAVTPIPFLSEGRIQRALETCAPWRRAGSTRFCSSRGCSAVSQRTTTLRTAGTTCPASSVTVDVAQRAASAARWVMTRTLRSPAAASTPPSSSSARAGSSPLVGSSSTRTGPGASRARATARRRRSPPDRATPSSPTGVSSPSGSAATQAVEAGRAQRVGDLRLGGVGPAEDEVGPHRAGEHLRPLVGQRAGGRARRPGAAPPRRCRRATACRPRAASSAGAR